MRVLTIMVSANVWSLRRSLHRTIDSTDILSLVFKFLSPLGVDKKIANIEIKIPYFPIMPVLHTVWSYVLAYPGSECNSAFRTSSISL